jgi:hypothetical protein
MRHESPRTPTSHKGTSWMDHVSRRRAQETCPSSSSAWVMLRMAGEKSNGLAGPSATAGACPCATATSGISCAAVRHAVAVHAPTVIASARQPSA